MKLVLAFMFLAAQAAGTQVTPIRVSASEGVKAVMADLTPQCERAIGHPLVMQFDTSAAMKRIIESGDPFDVAILAPEVMSDLVTQKRIASGTTVDIGRSGIGIGIRTGAKKPDISTPKALKQTLLKAKSIAYAKEGASRVYIEHAIERLGIADDLKSKTVLGPGRGASQESVAEGQVELVLILISEILPVRGIELVGPLPAELQGYVRFQAAIGANAKDRDAAGALIRCLTNPAAEPVYKAKGIEMR